METIDLSESLFEDQLFVGEEGLLAAECNLGDVGIVSARDEVLIASVAYAMLAHDLNIYEIGVLYLSIAAQAMIASLKNRFQEE